VFQSPFPVEPKDFGLCGFVLGAARFSDKQDITLALLLREVLQIWPAETESETGQSVLEHREQMTMALVRTVSLLQDLGKIKLYAESPTDLNRQRIHFVCSWRRCQNGNSCHQN